METVFVLIGAGGTLLGVYHDKQGLLDAFTTLDITCEVVNEKRIQLVSPLGQVIATIFECEVVN